MAAVRVEDGKVEAGLVVLVVGQVEVITRRVEELEIRDIMVGIPPGMLLLASFGVVEVGAEELDKLDIITEMITILILELLLEVAMV